MTVDRANDVLDPSRDFSRPGGRTVPPFPVYDAPGTPERVGDYMAGPSLVLPTGGSARFASPLGVGDFIKRTSIIEYDAPALAAQADDIERLTAVEEHDGHGRAVRIRVREG